MLGTATNFTFLLPLILCLAACSEQNQTPNPASIVTSMFTGRLDSADAVVGIAVSSQGNVKAYVCGGETSFATQSRWFVGALSPNATSIETDGFRLDVSPRTDKASITLTEPNGTVHSTDADLAGTGNHSALYESPLDSDCRWGVVVMDDGTTEPVVWGTWCQLTPNKIYAQVTPVLPIDFSKTLLPVSVNTPTGEQVFDVHLASPDSSTP